MSVSRKTYMYNQLKKLARTNDLKSVSDKRWIIIDFKRPKNQGITKLRFVPQDLGYVRIDYIPLGTSSFSVTVNATNVKQLLDKCKHFQLLDTELVNIIWP